MDQVCVHGESLFPFLVAVVVPNLTAIYEYFGVNANNTSAPNLESYCARTDAKDLVLNDFRYLATLNKVIIAVLVHF